ncbi:MAG TPA: hypothetical protein VF396_04450 [Bradyrhizobium sp.]
MAPAAVKTTIRQNEPEKAARLEQRPLAFNGSSFPVAKEVPSPSTRIIPESQPWKFSVAEEIRVHQRKALNSSDFVPTVTKKPHIPLNGAGFPSSGTFRQGSNALHG